MIPTMARTPAVAARPMTGWYSSTVGLLELVASVVAGLLWDRVGHAAVFYYGAIFGLAGSIGLVVLIPKRDHPSAV